MATMTKRTMLTAGLAAGAATALAGAAAAQPRTLKGGKVALYAHRGASALRPEHTLGSYAKAIADGTDFIEPDLVSTKDGVLVARHEPNIAETTDVEAHPEFAARRRTLTYEGRPVTGWFTIDFTLDELKTLRCKERLGAKLRPESASYDGQFQIVTWEEMIDFAAAESAARGRVIGLVPELKSSTWHAANGHPIDDRFVEIISRHKHTRTAPLHIQCFEVDPLKMLHTRLADWSNVKRVQLVGSPRERPQDHLDTTYGDMLTPAGLRTMRTYAEVVAPNLRGVIPTVASGNIGQPNSLIRDAHAAALEVVVWTFRPENQFLPKDLRSAAGPDARHPDGSLAEMKRFIDAGVDGFFTDDPALGRKAIEAG